MEKKYNAKSPAVKRLMREAIELREPTFMYHAQPLEDNLFEWHFTIIGSKGTDYEGGRYHGRIILPTEYPMKPPSIILLTPNGRFELHQKICLSASSYHPELWQPSWSIRTVLLAIIGFMPTEGMGSVGSLDCPADERRRMAKRSGSWTCPVCGIANKDILPEATDGNSQQLSSLEEEASQIATQMAFQSEAEVKAAKARLQQQHSEAAAGTLQQEQAQPESTPNSSAPLSHPASPSQPVNQMGGVAPRSEGVSYDQSPDLRHRWSAAQGDGEKEPVTVKKDASSVWSGTVSYIIMWILIVAILGLLLRRLFNS
eukprot:Em0023g533a